MPRGGERECHVAMRGVLAPLGRHVRVRADEGCAHFLRRVELGGEAEVGDLYLAVRIEQNVPGLHVAVHLMASSHMVRIEERERDGLHSFAR